MFIFCLKRILSYKPLYLAILIGCAITVSQFYLDVYPNIQYNKISPYSSWFEGVTPSTFVQLFFQLLPLLVAIPCADFYSRDVRTGYWNAILVRGKAKGYFLSLYIINFIIAGCVAVLPLLINVYISFMNIPNKPIDPIIENNNITLSGALTLFPDLYFSNPFLHMLMYIGIAFICAGLFATIGLTVSHFTQKSFIVLLTPFVIIYIWNYLCSIFDKLNYNFISFMKQQGDIFGIKFLPICEAIFLLLFVCTTLYVYGVRKRVVH